MEQLIEFGVFAGKLLVTFLFVVGLILLVTSLVLRQRMKPELEVEHLNEKLDEIKLVLQGAMLDRREYKSAAKEFKKKDKKKEKDKSPAGRKPHVFHLAFEGDLHAHAVDSLRDEITAVLMVAQAGDEVVLSIESPGGTVHGYGLGAAQILRLKDAGLKVTACVDRVAASGGYMMACTAHKVLAAPFAIMGSIGVLAQVPNFNRLLKKHDVDYEEISSGEYKRTVSVLGEITEKGRAKFQEQIADTHQLFKEFVKRERPQVDLAQVATGEYWYGLRAKELNLVDELVTSDAYLIKRKDEAEIYRIKYIGKKTLSEKLSEALGHAVERAFERVSEKLMERPRF